jgi:hypothetical protein
MRENIKNEVCVLCGEELNILINTNIENRENYIEGAGQLCKNCALLIYKNKLSKLKIN